MTAIQAIIDTYRAALPAGRLLEFPVTAIDRIGVPTWSVTFWPDQGSDAGGHGYGTTEEAAQLGAYGELSEVVHASAATRRLPIRQASYRELLAERGAEGVLDPLTLTLPAGSPYTADMPLLWLPIARWTTGATVLAPAEYVAFQAGDLPSADWLTTPITNGLGAGLSLEEALGHGLLELVQRDGNSATFRAADTGVAVDLDAVSDPETRATLVQLDRAGVDVIVKLAATDFGMANLFVVGADRDAAHGDPLMATACGEAAHPDREVALRKALLEFAAARARKAFTHGPLGPVARVAPPGYLDEYLAHIDLTHDEPRALKTMMSWLQLSNGKMRALLADSVLAVRNCVPLSSLPTVAQPLSRAEVARTTIERMLAEGLDVLYADCSPLGDTGVHVVKAIVPGLEVETMSYYRIGPRNITRLLERNSDMVGVGTPPPGALPIHLTALDEERVGGAAWLDPQAVDRVVGKLYPLYREPYRHYAPYALERRIHL